MPSQAAHNDNFKNESSRRFHQYFYPRVKEREIDSKKFFEDFQISYANPMQFFSGLRYGDRSITLEHIDIAQRKYGVNPNYLFGLTDVATEEGDYVLFDATTTYGDEYRREVGRKLKDIFEKHKVNIAQYAQERLGMTEQNLYKILRGQGRPYWDLVVTVCEDHGESLDVFRTKPLPKGHLLEQVTSLKSMNEILKERLKELEGKK
ncbi:MAG: hypothetical protein INR73_18120 [Williamsia sp.]|nr:hypothetical protein [Williamsia sp.]